MSIRFLCVPYIIQLAAISKVTLTIGKFKNRAIFLRCYNTIFYKLYVYICCQNILHKSFIHRFPKNLIISLIQNQIRCAFTFLAGSVGKEDLIFFMGDYVLHCYTQSSCYNPIYWSIDFLLSIQLLLSGSRKVLYLEIVFKDEEVLLYHHLQWACKNQFRKDKNPLLQCCLISGDRMKHRQEPIRSLQNRPRTSHAGFMRREVPSNHSATLREFHRENPAIKTKF